MGATLSDGVSPALLRRLNSIRVLTELRADGPLSRSELSRVTRQSRPTVSAVIADLKLAGYVTPVDEQPSGTVGRPAQPYAFCADHNYVVGIDIGAFKIVMLLADLNGAVVTRRYSDSRDVGRRGSLAMIEHLAREGEALLRQGHVGRQKLHKVVAGTPGVVSPTGTIGLAPQLPGWDATDLAASLTEIFGCPSVIDRETYLSLLAEQWKGHAIQLVDALYLQLGVGVGAAFLLNGQIYRGSQGAAGEIGLMPIGGVGAGGFGPFESAVGGAALARAGQELARTPRGRRLLELAGGDVELIDAAAVFTAAHQGDDEARVIIDAVLDQLAVGVASLVCALNPSVIIVAGGLSLAGDQLLKPLKERVSRMVPYPPDFIQSQLGDEAVALGAIRLATQNIEEELIALLTPT